MRENRPSGSEGGAILIQSSLPLSFIGSLRDQTGPFRTHHRQNLPLSKWKGLQTPSWDRQKLPTFLIDVSQKEN
jgi:hypothetical protein